MSVAAVPAAGDPDLPTLRADLTEKQFRALWNRLRVLRPSLENFAASPQLAASALEVCVGPQPGCWVEIRRMGSPRGDAWAVHAGGFDVDAADRLRAMLDGRRMKPQRTPEIVARLHRRHRINMRVALGLAILALGLLWLIAPLLVLPA